MHMKLNKFANLNKGLNEQSEILKKECDSLKQDMSHVREERDALSEEIMILRAQAEEHQREKQRFAILQRQMMELEEKYLTAKREIKTRDETIEELATQLDQSLDLLEAERVVDDQNKKKSLFFPIGL